MTTLQDMLALMGDQYVVGMEDNYASIANATGTNATELYNANGGASLNAGMTITVPQPAGTPQMDPGGPAPIYPPGYTPPQPAGTPQMNNGILYPTSPVVHAKSNAGSKGTQPASQPFSNGIQPITGSGFNNPLFNGGIDPLYNPLSPPSVGVSPASGRTSIAGDYKSPTGRGPTIAEALAGGTGGTGMSMTQPTITPNWDLPAPTIENFGEVVDAILSGAGYLTNQNVEGAQLESIGEAATSTSVSSEDYPPPVGHSGTGPVDPQETEEDSEIRQLGANYERFTRGWVQPDDFILQLGYYNMQMIDAAMAAGDRDLLPEYLNDAHVEIIYREYNTESGIFTSKEEFYDTLGYDPVPGRPGLWKKKASSTVSDGNGGGYGYARGYGYGYPSGSRGSYASYPGLLEWRIGFE